MGNQQEESFDFSTMDERLEKVAKEKISTLIEKREKLKGKSE